VRLHRTGKKTADHCGSRDTRTSLALYCTHITIAIARQVKERKGQAVSCFPPGTLLLLVLDTLTAFLFSSQLHNLPFLSVVHSHRPSREQLHFTPLHRPTPRTSRQYVRLSPIPSHLLSVRYGSEPLPLQSRWPDSRFPFDCRPRSKYRIPGSFVPRSTC